MGVEILRTRLRVGGNSALCVRRTRIADICDPQKRRSRTCAFYLFIRQPHGSEVSPAARNSLDSAPIPTASKLLICGLFQKGRVLAQDGVRLAR